MLLPRLGSIYKRLAGRSYVRGLAGFRRRRLVKVRSLLPAPMQLPVTVKTGRVRLLITPDPVDAKIADSIVNRHAHVYFPDSVDPFSVRLVLEIGGHHGLYTAVAASMYPRARIVTLEPSLDALAVLRKQLRLNDLERRVDVIPAALGGESGTAILSHDPSGSWGATLYSPDDVTRREIVVTLPLSAVLGEQVPDILKSNAEGAEFELVPQLEGLAKRPPVLVLAVHPEFGEVDGLRDRLIGMGYSVSDAQSGHHPVWHCTTGDPAPESR